MGQSTPIFQNINRLKWIYFLEIIKTHNLHLLDANYRLDKKYSNKFNKLFEQEWVKLQDEIYLLENSIEAKSLINKNFEKLILVEKIKLLEKDMKLLVWYANQYDIFKENKKELEWEKEIQGIYKMITGHIAQIKLNVFNSIEDNLKILERSLLSLINEYNTKHKDIESKVEKKKKSIYHDVHQINMITGLKLNPNEMVCSEWIEAKNIAKEINLQNTKQNTNV